jgi:hypothetical protein
LLFFGEIEQQSCPISPKKVLSMLPQAKNADCVSLSISAVYRTPAIHDKAITATFLPHDRNQSRLTLRLSEHHSRASHHALCPFAAR